MSREPVGLRIDAAVATVRLERPEVHNAFEPRLIGRLTEIFHELSQDSNVRAVVLAGAGKSFCAGADLQWMQQIARYGQAENLEDARRLAGMFEAIDRCPKPVVGRIQGAAMGGGMGLIAVCDVVVADRSARFAFTEARLGLAPAVIAPFVLAKIGPGAARELFLTARQFGAEEAQRLGLVHRVAEEQQLDAGLSEVLKELLAGAPAAQAACKALVRRVAVERAEGIRDFTTSLIAELRGSSEGRAGMAAFLARSKAPWVVPPPPVQEPA
jgi:methylglutaconyl-CoA hydratase